LERTILRPEVRPGASVVLLVWEVQPARGGSSFVDERALLIGTDSLAQLQPGSVVGVRYPEARRSPVVPASLPRGK
jgi:hypothetical protein